jgi:hypothetical protein
VNGIGQPGLGRFAHEQMHVLRHYYVSVNAQSELTARVLEAEYEEIEEFGGGEVWLAVITTEGDEVGLSGFLKAAETAGHRVNLHRRRHSSKGPRLAPTERARTWGTFAAPPKNHSQNWK